MSKRQRQRLTSEQAELLREAAIQIRDAEKITSAAQIARRLTQQHGIRVTRQRVHEWLQQDALTPAEVVEYRKDRRKLLVQQLYAAAEKYIEHAASPETIAKAGPQAAATVIGILIDKALLASGEATERTEVINRDTPRERLAGRLAQLAERRRASAAAERPN